MRKPTISRQPFFVRKKSVLDLLSDGREYMPAKIERLCGLSPCQLREVIRVLRHDGRILTLTRPTRYQIAS